MDAMKKNLAWNKINKGNSLCNVWLEDKWTPNIPESFESLL